MSGPWWGNWACKGLEKGQTLICTCKIVQGRNNRLEVYWSTKIQPHLIMTSFCQHGAHTSFSFISQKKVFFTPKDPKLNNTLFNYAAFHPEKAMVQRWVSEGKGQTELQWNLDELDYGIILSLMVKCTILRNTCDISVPFPLVKWKLFQMK